MSSYRLNAILLLCLIMIACSCSNSSTVESNLGHVASTLDQSIWAIYQDSSGDYWFGSNGSGLFRYNGERFTQYTNVDGLVDNQIRGIQEDHNGNLFIETPKGVSRFDGDTFTTLKLDRSARDDWKMGPNDLWFSCNGRAQDVFRYNGERLYELKLPEQPLLDSLNINPIGLSYSPYSVFSIQQDSKGNILFGTVLAGAFRFDGESFLWIGATELSRLPDGREPGVRTMLRDKNGYYWLGQSANKFSLSDSTYKMIESLDFSSHFPEVDNLFFNSGISDENGDLWLAAFTEGVWQYDGTNWESVPIQTTVEELQIISIYQDNDGALWLGTINDGVYHFTDGSFKKVSFK